MNGATTISIETLVSILSVFIAVMMFFIGQRSGARKEGQEKGVLLTELGHIKETVTKIELRVNDINVERINADIVILKEQVKTLQQDYKSINKRASDVKSNS